MFEGLPRPWNWRCTRLPQAGGTLGTWWILGVVPSVGRRASGQVRSITHAAPENTLQNGRERNGHRCTRVRLGSVDVRGDWLEIPGQAWKKGVGVWLRNHAHTHALRAATVARLLANMAVAIQVHWPAAAAAAEWVQQQRQTATLSYNNQMKGKLHSIDSLCLMSGIYGASVALGKTEHFTDQQNNSLGSKISSAQMIPIRLYLSGRIWYQEVEKGNVSIEHSWGCCATANVAERYRLSSWEKVFWQLRSAWTLPKYKSYNERKLGKMMVTGPGHCF